MVAETFLRLSRRRSSRRLGYLRIYVAFRQKPAFRQVRRGRFFVPRRIFGILPFLYIIQKQTGGFFLVSVLFVSRNIRNGSFRNDSARRPAPVLHPVIFHIFL
jgi:hypothetical protein